MKEAGARSLARTKNFMLTEKLKASRQKRKKVRSILKKKTLIILFSDEKYFTVNLVSNSCHDQFISSLKVSDIPDKIKFAPHTKDHDLRINCSDGKKMPPVFLHSRLHRKSSEASLGFKQIIITLQIMF